MSTKPDWMDVAVCAGADTSVWFPEGSDVATRDRAKYICRECPVRLDCLRHALAEHERHGIWGGINMANGFAKKGLHPGLPDAILEQAIQGRNPLNPRRGRQRTAQERQRAITALAAEGRTTIQIAEALGLTPKGVKGIARRHGIEIPSDRRGPHLTSEEEAEIPGMVLRLVEGIERRTRAS